jgi:carnitine 3-dehydrogenase
MSPDPSRPLTLAQLRVLPSWIDYNGHMTEGRYLLACSEVTDALLRLIGAGLDYVAAGRSYYTAETHLIHLGEARAGDLLTGVLQILAADAKRLHVFVTLTIGDRPVATLEQMLLHVDMATGRVVPADPAVFARLIPLAAAQAALARPPAAGRHVGQPR